MSLLFSPVTFGKFSLNGRLVLPPMASAKADKNGAVTEDLCRYYDEKTRGGYIGLVITEHAYVSPEGRLTAGQLSAAEDGCIEGLKRLAAVIRKNGPAVIAQITHAGGAASSVITGLPVLGAGSIRPSGAVSHEDTPQTMNRDDIRKVISDFAAAARRIEKAGFDGVEIHSAHGYLLNQFYSPLLNDRTDEYTGQTLAGRLKLHLEIVEAVRDTGFRLQLGSEPATTRTAVRPHGTARKPVYGWRRRARTFWIFQAAFPARGTRIQKKRVGLRK